MNDEIKQQLLVFVRFLFVFTFGALYALGGIDHLWLRRFVAPTELTIGMFIFSRDWKVFLQTPLMMGTLCIGYGSDITWIKIVKRFIWGLLNGISSGFYILRMSLDNAHLWVAFSLQVILATLVCVLLGAFNPLVNARAEEFFIGCIIAFLPMMTVKRK